MPDIISTVGNGHTSPDYATLALYNAGDGGLDPGVGFTAIAECSGYLGAAANINGTFIRGAIIRGDVAFDGTNDSLLSSAEQLTISAGSGINVEDLRIFTNNQYISALNYNADFIVIDRVVLDNTTAGMNAIDINGDFTNGHIRNFVARGGADAVMAGFNQGTNLTNGLVYGAVDKGVEGSSSAPMVLTNIFAFNNGGQDIDSAGGFTLIDVATEDATGTYTGYTSAELVGFASGDLRTKSTSDLASLGTPFIGAFLEAGGSTIEVTGNTASFDYSAVPASIDLTGSIEVTGSTANFDYSAITGSIDLTGEISITGQTANFDYNSVNGLIDLTGELSVTGQTANFNYIAKPADIDLTGEITITGATSNFDHTSVNGAIELGAVINVVGQTANFDINGVNAEASLTGEIIVTGQTAIFNYIAMSGSVIIGTGQKIGKVTAGFADSGISVQYKQSTITVKFGE